MDGGRACQARRLDSSHYSISIYHLYIMALYIIFHQSGTTPAARRSPPPAACPSNKFIRIWKCINLFPAGRRLPPPAHRPSRVPTTGTRAMRPSPRAVRSAGSLSLALSLLSLPPSLPPSLSLSLSLSLPLSLSPSLSVHPSPGAVRPAALSAATSRGGAAKSLSPPEREGGILSLER